MQADINFRMVNLNSLPILREILRHGNIARAAEVLNLTPPALSNTLRQLRAYFEDELIVREGRSMRLTPKALRLIAPLEQALSSMQTVLAEQDFSPTASTNHFRVAMTDHIMNMIGAPLALILRNEAPDMQVHFVTASRSSVPDLFAGRIDMVITPKFTLASGLPNVAALNSVSMEHLTSEEMLCIGREDDAELRDGISVERYLARSHIGFFLDAEQHISAEQAFLKSSGIKQKDRLLVSCYSILPRMVAITGHLSVVPEGLAKSAERQLPIQVVNPPIPLPNLEWTMVWHNRNDAHPALQWLKETFKRCVQLSADEFDHSAQLGTPKNSSHLSV